MIFKDPKIKSSEITPKEVFHNRRKLLKILTFGSLPVSLSSSLQDNSYALTENKKIYYLIVNKF
jgi:hypothetical protein